MRRSVPLLLLATAIVTGCASGGRRGPATPAPAERPTRSDQEKPAETAPVKPKKKVERGLASWYGNEFHGRLTASGEPFDQNQISAAHRTLPFGTVVRVTNLDNGRTLDVRINDRGPFVKGRILDLSRAAAAELDMVRAGVARIELRVVDQQSRHRPTAAEREGDLLVQAGAFHDKPRAVDLAHDLRALDSRFRVYSAGGWHRVQARGLDESAADDLLRRLLAQGIAAVIAANR